MERNRECFRSLAGVAVAAEVSLSLRDKDLQNNNKKNTLYQENHIHEVRQKFSKKIFRHRSIIINKRIYFYFFTEAL